MRVKGYTWRPVVGLANDPVIEPRLLILHVDAGNADSLFNWFNGPSAGIESHLFIPRDEANDNEQYRDTTREADANYRANSWVSGGVRYGAISVETGGLGPGTWNARQLADIKALITAVHDEHDIPYRVAGSAHGHGVGYHTLFPSWSNVSGKTCPGPARIKQFHEVIVPWMVKQRPLVIDVKQGDTWAKLAARHDTTPLALVKRNRPLKAGQKIRIR